MKHIIRTAVVSLMLVTVGAAAADARTRHVVAPAIAANIGTDRLGALVDPALFAAVTTVTGSKLPRFKNVLTVRHVAGTGEYCIKPKAGISVKTIIPALSVDFALSNISTGAAFWESDGGGCNPLTEIAVLTVDATTGDPSDDVAFAVLVP